MNILIFFNSKYIAKLHLFDFTRSYFNNNQELTKIIRDVDNGRQKALYPKIYKIYT